MRKLTYLVAATLDGFIAGPDATDPTGSGIFTMEGDHMAALLDEYPDIVPVQAREALGLASTPNKHFDTVVEGRVSYEGGLAAGIPNAYPHLRHLVFTRTMTESPDPGVEIVSSDPVEVVRELKREAGQGIWLVGGGSLAAALRPEIDELVIKLHPVTVGNGIRMFEGDFDPAQFRLTRSQTFESGVLHLTYERR
ncbi:dihydrofolate reductase [Saccharopolyspora erythraea NRRL 2338]|uniref:Possible dihydrofolate reductase n=2 Tax=Saccharopolyspora erythraea TaxID=1836 RepID=A4FNY9_SACEN|nr:dihydrofolate reductase family protein [Saccharopolyspora erythraea]EQD86531.1 deaminase reductase [Saccharopolyspora erythraea D]PFG99405.1 dihydrofolate reductase [Saccharopolyspora erythraea NRRL 2338]QRK89319.1 dihydrofolate reductase family protein [Saccharopolyspora erythraea]CAM05764.1 possible dihydrofolate reductase [Saccharopolyspora erythraea NRRL 2338]